jgi:hypothetical protein
MPETKDANSKEQHRKRDAAAAVLLFGAADYLSAGYLWRRHAPRAYSGLLDNQSWRWDDQRQKYVSSSGKTLTDDHAKKLSILFALAMALEFEDDAAHAFSGIVSVKQWAESFAGKLRSTFVVQGALGVGGLHRVTATDEATIVGSVADETGLAFSLDRMKNFAASIEAKKDSDGNPLKESAVRNRSGLYAAATNTTYEATKRNSHVRAKSPDGKPLFLFERSILSDAVLDHCYDTEHTEGCVEAAAAGWVPIGTLPLPGLRTCRMACVCEMRHTLVPPKDES